jgi:hypothetical protein
MFNEEEVVQDDSSNVQDETVEVLDDEAEEESIEDIKARLKKAEELAENQKIRAEKAERKAKEVVPETPSSLTIKDMYALTNAKVAEEDISTVEKYAALEGISVSEALKTDLVKSILARKDEERRVAAGTNTGTARRGSSAKVTDAQLLERARKGEMPESVEDIARLNQLRWFKK